MLLLHYKILQYFVMHFGSTSKSCSALVKKGASAMLNPVMAGLPGPVLLDYDQAMKWTDALEQAGSQWSS